MFCVSFFLSCKFFNILFNVVYLIIRLQQAANDKYFKLRVTIFLQKFNLATKTQRHKRKCYAFFCFVPLCLRGNRFSPQSGKKILLIVIVKELQFFLYVSQPDSIIFAK